MKSMRPGGVFSASLTSLGSLACVRAIIIWAPRARRPGISSLAVSDADLYMRSGGRELMVPSLPSTRQPWIPLIFQATYHSRSPSPMKPILMLFEDSRIKVFGQLARGTSSPRPGSRTLASSQGKVHCLLRCRNWGTPKSRSWFCERCTVSIGQPLISDNGCPYSRPRTLRQCRCCSR